MAAHEQIDAPGDHWQKLAREIEDAAQSYPAVGAKTVDVAADLILQGASTANVEGELNAKLHQFIRNAHQMVSAFHGNQAAGEGQSQRMTVQQLPRAKPQRVLVCNLVLPHAGVEVQQRVGIDPAIGLKGRRSAALYACSVRHRRAKASLGCSRPMVAAPAQNGIGGFSANDLPSR